jgi:hypothetical protein
LWLLASVFAVVRARISIASAQEPALHIEVPTKLEKASVVFDMGHPSNERVAEEVAREI